MKRLWGLMVMVLMLLTATAVSAQGNQGEPIPGGGLPTAAFLLLVGMSSGVASFVEFVKTSALKPLWANTKWGALSYAAAAQILAFIASLVLVYAYPAVSLFDALGIYPNLDDTFSKIITAFSISFGNMVLHALHDYLASGAGVKINTDRATVITDTTTTTPGSPAR